MNHIIQNDIDFIKNSIIINLNPNDIDSVIADCEKKILRIGNKNLTLCAKTEIFSDYTRYVKLIKYCTELNNRGIPTKVLTSTLSDIPHGFYPLTNILSWNNANFHASTELIFKKENFINNFDKSKKYILSWRKGTSHRNYIISKINLEEINTDECIFKFHSKSPKLNVKYDEVNDDFLNWNDVVSLYKKSYISFVAETEYWVGENRINFHQFTEKTLLPFLSKSLPVVYSRKGYDDALRDNGLFTLNKFFGVKDGDMDSYADCISYINSLKYEEVEKIYNKHSFRIKRNYEITSKLILNPFWIMSNGEFINFV